METHLTYKPIHTKRRLIYSSIFLAEITQKIFATILVHSGFYNRSMNRCVNIRIFNFYSYDRKLTYLAYLFCNRSQKECYRLF